MKKKREYILLCEKCNDQTSATNLHAKWNYCVLCITQRSTAQSCQCENMILMMAISMTIFNRMKDTHTVVRLHSFLLHLEYVLLGFDGECVKKNYVEYKNEMTNIDSGQIDQ